ncbi:ankyrin repeat-containing domain protein [Xylaria curta]|nr:ankyrin repeat-containing domain protein [Xylaria curta]
MNADSDASSLDWSGKPPLILAANSGSLESTESLLKSSAVNLDATDSTYEQSAVSYAAENGNEEIVRLLIKAECCIYSRESQRYPPLERAAWSDDLNLLRLFNEEKSDKSPEALRYACDYNCVESIKSILAKSQYLTAVDEDSRTVLSLAAQSGHKQVITYSEADEKFSAMSLQFLQGVDTELKPNRVPLKDLLSGDSTSLRGLLSGNSAS